MSTLPVTTIRKSNYEECRVGLSEFRGNVRIDVRIWAEPRNGQGDRVATPHGVSLRLESLPELRAAIEAAEREAVARGLLPQGGSDHG